MNKPIIFMFSGQGSHHYQMGRTLYEKQPYFKAWLDKGDRLAQKQLGLSVLEHLYAPQHKASHPFTETRLTHPTIFMVEYSLAQTLMMQGIEPDAVLGVSMGSFAALAVAESLTFETALLAVIKQAECLEKSCQPGGMVTILDTPTLFDKTPWLYQQSTLAGINFDKHFVISARQKKLPLLQQALNQAKITAQKLPVSYAFHSAEIDPARDSYCDFLQTLPQQAPQLPFICCATATTQTGIPTNYLWTVVREPIRFQQTIANLERQQAWTYLDLGPSSTLATFVKYNLSAQSNSDTISIMTPFNQDVSNLNQLLKSNIGT